MRSLADHVKIVSSIGAVAVAVLLLSSCGWIGETFLTNRTPCDYYLPDGFHGWAEVTFETAGAPPLPKQAGRYVVRFPQTARLTTSTPIEYGSAHDRYFYYSARGTQELSATGWGEGGQIWAAETIAKGNGSRARERFFVGTQKQYYQSIGDPRG